MSFREEVGNHTEVLNYLFCSQNSLADLVSKLQAASPHFVRCIKPNTSRSPMMYVPEHVLAQIRYTGISEIVKIRKFGYVLRITFYDFLNRLVDMDANARSVSLLIISLRTVWLAFLYCTLYV